jgi:hypothetical protein
MRSTILSYFFACCQLLTPNANKLLIRFSLAFGFAISIISTASAQVPPLDPVLPVLPFKLKLELLTRTKVEVEWKIGPLQIRLPDSWFDYSMPSTVQFRGPDKSLATFTTLKVTPEALSTGYSVLTDRNHGPAAFIKHVFWDVCTEKPEKVGEILVTSSDRIAMYASCQVDGSFGLPTTYVQIVIYSSEYIFFIHAVGNESNINSILSVIKDHQWKD